MMGFDISMTPEAERFLVKMAKESPREVRRALGLACGIVRSRMRREMRGGAKSRLARWQPITSKIRSTQHYAYSGTFGGKLVYPGGRQIAIVPYGDYCRVGWIDALEPASVRFQDGGTVEISKGMRHRLYMTGKFEHGEIPATSEQPQRQVVDPIAEEARGKFADWVASIFERVMKNMIANSERRLASATTTAQRLRYAKAAARGYATISHGDVYELQRRGLIR